MKLSVVIPNRNDTVMLAITVRSALEALKGVEGGGQVVVADNSDNDIWEILKTPNVSPLPLTCMNDNSLVLVRQSQPGLYAARELGIRESAGEYCLNVDSHTVIGHNTLADLVRFMDNDTERKVGFAFGPLGWVSQHESYARHDIRINNGVYGNWGMQYKTPTKICWNFGWRICRRDWFLNQFGGYGFYATRHVSWGGGEMYAPIKAWLLGYENWAVPTDAFYHIGPFAKEIEARTPYRYRLYGNSGEGKLGIGVVAAFYALGGDEMKAEALKCQGAIQTNFQMNVNKVWAEAKSLAHDDWMWLKDRQTISYFDLMKQQPWDANGWGTWDQWDKDVALSIYPGLIRGEK